MSKTDIAVLILILACGLSACTQSTSAVKQSQKKSPAKQTQNQSPDQSVVLTPDLAGDLMKTKASSTFKAILAPYERNEQVLVVHALSKTKYPGFLLNKSELPKGLMASYQKKKQTLPVQKSVLLVIEGKLKPYAASYQTNPEVDPSGVVYDYKIIHMATVDTPKWTPFKATEHK